MVIHIISGRSPHGERGLKCIFMRVRRIKKLGRSPHGERGLKSSTAKAERQDIQGRSPHGERGLKSYTGLIIRYNLQSLSSRRAWIEIAKNCLICRARKSLSSRRAWIEINLLLPLYWIVRVALLTESVD